MPRDPALSRVWYAGSVGVISMHNRHALRVKSRCVGLMGQTTENSLSVVWHLPGGSTWNAISRSHSTHAIEVTGSIGVIPIWSPTQVRVRLLDVWLGASFNWPLSNSGNLKPFLRQGQQKNPSKLASARRSGKFKSLIVRIHSLL